MPLESNQFDIVLIKNLLHHLVGTTRYNSKKNVKKAIKELKRVVKDEGYIIILEQYNAHNLFSSILFYITFFLSFFGISIRSFGLNKSIVVSFLTPKEILNMINEDDNVSICLEDSVKSEIPKKYKYTFLMSNIGHELVICKYKH